MAGTPPPVDIPKLGIKATVAGLVFALTILAGFGAATAASYDADAGKKDKYGDEHSDDDKHGDDKEHKDDENHGDE